MRPVAPRCLPVVLGGALVLVLGLLNVPTQAASLSGRVESVSASEVVVTLTEPKAGEGLRVGDVGFVLEPSGERIARLEVKTISGASVGAALEGVTRQVTPGAQVVFDTGARPSTPTATAPGDPIAADDSAEAQRRANGLQSLPLEGAPAPAKVVRRIAEPKLLHRVEPRYPRRASGISALVILEIEVDARGNVAAAKVLRGHPLFDRAALDAVKQWRYEPLRLNGRETSFRLTVPLFFRP